MLKECARLALERRVARLDTARKSTQDTCAGVY